MTTTKQRLQHSAVTPVWSEKYGKTLYRLTVANFSKALMFNADELEALRNHIDLVLEDTYDRSTQ